MAVAQLTRPELWERFAARAAALGAGVTVVPGLARASGLLADADRRVAVTAGLAARYPELAAQYARLPESEERSPDIATCAAFAVAETGSVLLSEHRADRAACFLAERLWVLVDEEQVLPTLDEALARIRDLARGEARYVTLVSGPSRTADIERTLTIGVHGPREVAIVVVGSA